MNGKGAIQFSNGDKYTGNFLNNKFHGQGILFLESKQSKFTG